MRVTPMAFISSFWGDGCLQGRWRLTQQDKELIIKMNAKGCSNKRICEVLDIVSATVSRILNQERERVRNERNDKRVS